MADINQFTFTGHLTRDAEYKTLPSGKGLLVASVAVNTGFGAYAKTTYVKVQQWGMKGANVVPYLKTGTLVAVSGELTISEWLGKDGMKHSELVVDTFDIKLFSVTATQSVPTEALKAQADSKEPLESEVHSSDFEDSDVPF